MTLSKEKLDDIFNGSFWNPHDQRHFDFEDVAKIVNQYDEGVPPITICYDLGMSTNAFGSFFRDGFNNINNGYTHTWKEMTKIVNQYNEEFEKWKEQ